MIFNSWTFVVFFLLVFAIFWSLHLKGVQWRNFFILVASYVFYGWWDWRFLSLIVLSSFVDFFVGKGLKKSEIPRRRRMLLFVSLGVNLGLLFVFKYFNFFVDSFIGLLNAGGIQANPYTLQVILPVGISFYTFQTLSYSIDVYRRKLEPTDDWIAFFAYVGFFPQLVAGPIERATNLLPQFQNPVTFSYPLFRDGLRLILWGFFLKSVVADNLADPVNTIFENYQSLPASTLALGVFYFAFQIYGDFAGYSNIARGVANLLGFRLMVNFRNPYFSRDIAEFWRRWHISLSTWFRDYVYFPLGGSRGEFLQNFRNVIIVFLVSGAWHGANWTFIVWGGLHALFYIPLLVLGNNRRNLGLIAENRFLPQFRECVSILSTFILVCIARVFFRAETVQQAGSILLSMVDTSLFEIPGQFRSGLVLVFVLLVVEWINRDDDVPIRFDGINRTVRWLIYSGIFACVYYRGFFGTHEFIYFQF